MTKMARIGPAVNEKHVLSENRTYPTVKGCFPACSQCMARHGAVFGDKTYRLNPQFGSLTTVVLVCQEGRLEA